MIFNSIDQNVIFHIFENKKYDLLLFGLNA